MTKRNDSFCGLPSVKGRKIELNFGGKHITSDAGLPIIQQIDDKLDLTKQASRIIRDPRDPKKVKHSVLSMIKQRVYGISTGYEDLNDHDTKRHDLIFQTAVKRDDSLASSPTLHRFEHFAKREEAVRLHELMVETFINSFDSEPEELILDFDATDFKVFGDQEGKYFNRYYDSYCFIPLYVFCGEQLLVSYLREANRGAATHAPAILSLLVKKFRSVWPKVKIIFRGDSGFCIPLLLEWCDRNEVDYIVGIGKNSKLEEMSFVSRRRMEGAYWIERSEKEKELQKERSSILEALEKQEAEELESIKKRNLQGKELEKRIREKEWEWFKRKRDRKKELDEKWKRAIGEIEKRVAFSELLYKTKSWNRKRRIIVKAEHADRGANTRYVVTSLSGEPEELYRVDYCMRGEMELYIGEQLSFFSDRTSCSEWWANQFRVLLSSMAYILVETLRRKFLAGTIFANKKCRTISLQLLKIGAIVTRNTRRICVEMSETFPHKELLFSLYQKLCPD